MKVSAYFCWKGGNNLPKLKTVPYEFKNEVENGVTTLTLSGMVRKKWWDDDECIDAKSIRDSLSNVDGDVVIKLNSPGGDVFEGIEIYNYLKSLSNHVTVEVTGIAASAASIIAMGADNILMNTGTSMMIHEASTWAIGNKHDVKKTLNALETIDESIVNIYVERTGKSAEQINEWLAEEKWFTAEEAVNEGFANATCGVKLANNFLELKILDIQEVKEVLETLRNEVAALKKDTVETPKETNVNESKLKLFGGTK